MERNANRMPCSITDGGQFEEQPKDYIEDEDLSYEIGRQDGIDSVSRKIYHDLERAIRDIFGKHYD